MREEERLFEACRILFGSEIILSQAFLDYLQMDGIKKAFRTKALETHPDKALSLGISQEESERRFELLTSACEILKDFIVSREAEQSINREPDIIRSAPVSDIKARPRIPFCRYLYKIGVIEWGQIVKALAWQKSSRPRIGELGIQFGYLDRDSVIIILKQIEKHDTFGITARKLGLLSEEEIQRLLQRQKYMQKKVGQFFVENQLMTESQLKRLLQQCEDQNRRHLK